MLGLEEGQLLCSPYVVRGNRPSSQRVSYKSMLGLEEGQLLCRQDRELVREIKSGEGVFIAARGPWILGKSQRCTSNARAEDLAHVIESAAVGVRCPHAQLFKQVVGAELGL